MLTADLFKLNIKLLLHLAGKALLRDWTFAACNPLGWNSPAEFILIFWSPWSTGVRVQGSIQSVAIKINTLLNPQPYRIIKHFSIGRDGKRLAVGEVSWTFCCNNSAFPTSDSILLVAGLWGNLISIQEPISTLIFSAGWSFPWLNVWYLWTETDS